MQWMGTVLHESIRVPRTSGMHRSRLNVFVHTGHSMLCQECLPVCVWRTEVPLIWSLIWSLIWCSPTSAPSLCPICHQPC